MCGIGGRLFGVRGDDDVRRTDTLSAALRHRGPDGDGVFSDDDVLLVHTRLALVDVAGGAQPLVSSNGRSALVVNGEIYNHRALRPRLEARGAVFRTRSDSEALLWTLLLDGAAGLVDVEGEYAFAFFDGACRTALLGRDPLGVKPLVWCVDEGAVWFASEVKALLAVLPHRRVLDVDAVITALVAPAFSGDRPPFIGIEAVPPGGVIEVDARGTRLLSRHTQKAATTTTTTTTQLATALQAAVVDRLQADVPVGAFISGGVDSTAILAAARTQTTSTPCFTIRFGENDVVAGSIVVEDDARFVEPLAEAWQLDLQRVAVSRAALVDDLAALVASQDRIVSWEQELSQRFLARAAARRVKAVLVGDAADETWFGYAFALADDVSASPRALLERFGLSRRAALLAPALRHRVDDVVAAIDDIARSAGTPFDGDASQRRLATTAVVIDRWLSRLLHNGDLHTMAFGLEARVPFADRRVLDVAARVGVDDGFVVDDRADGVPEKHFLRRAVASWLPPAIAQRRKSALPRDDGMGPLWRQHLRGLLADDTTCTALSPWLDLDAVAALAARDDDVDDTTRAVLFSVITFAGFLAHHAPSRS
ncbi:MAG TPA: asparagine synthase (glutamine-hydrolyzing) [Myxococcota bacterium]